MTDQAWDLVVLGGGPAGLASAAACARAGMSVKVVEHLGFGGQLMNAPLPLQVPAISGTSTGLDVASQLIEDVMNSPAVFSMADVEAIHPIEDDATASWEIQTSEGRIAAKRAILATGTRESPLSGVTAGTLPMNGVSYCAACDGPLFAGKSVGMVVGSDPWARTELLQLSQFASRVWAVIDPRAASSDLPSLGELPSNVTLLRGPVLAIRGERTVESMTVAADEGRTEVEIAGVFGAIGRIPNSEIAEQWAPLSPSGHVLVGADLQSAAHALYAVGDVRAGSPENAGGALQDAERLAEALTRSLR